MMDRPHVALVACFYDNSGPSDLTPKSNVDPTIGRRIRTKRKAIGMSQSELATSLGISFQQIQKYESGVSGIAERRLAQICKALDLPENFFESGHAMIGKAAEPEATGDAQTSDGTGSEPLDEAARTAQDAARLAEAFVKIPDANLRARIMEFVMALASDHIGKSAGTM